MVGVDALIAVVDRRQTFAMRGAIEERGRRNPRGFDDHVCRDWQIAVDSLARRQLIALGRRYSGVTPDGNAAPSFGGGEEIPIADRVAGGAVGDVVGSEREFV